MRVVWAIAKREIQAVLRSPRYYILLAFYLFAQGYDFSVLFLDDGALAIRLLMKDIAFLALFAAPLITAGSIAGERASGELRFLLSEPISETQLVMGKALGGLILLLPVGGSALIPVAAALWFSECSALPLLLAVFGLLLLTLACGAAGIFASSFTKHPASAAACSLGLLLMLAFLGVFATRSAGVTSFLTGGAGPEALSPFVLSDYLFRGILDSRPIVFFPLATVTFLLLAIIVLKSRRWQFTDDEGPQGHEELATRASLVSMGIVKMSLPLIVVFWIVHIANIKLHFSYDLSGFLSLSQTFQKMVETVPDKLHIYRIYRASNRRRLDDLLDEIVKNGKGKVVRHTWNVKKHFAQMRSLGLLVLPTDGLVLRMGNKVTTISEENLDVASRQAELSIAKAINILSPNESKFRVFFSKGHNEESTEALRRLVSTIGLKGENLSLESVEEIPKTSSALVIVGPRIKFTNSEISKVKSYLDNGGRVLICFDHDNHDVSKPLLELLPVKTTGELILDKTHTLAGGGYTSLIVVPKEKHPITKISGKLQLIMPGCTPVWLSPNREDSLHSNLILSHKSAATVENGAQVSNVMAWKNEGPYPLAVTVEGPKAQSPYYAAVFGDIDIFSDRILLSYPTNTTFALATMSWLCSQPPPAGITQGPLQVAVVISNIQAKQMMYIVSVAPAFFALFLGFLAWRQYRRRFAPKSE